MSSTNLNTIIVQMLSFAGGIGEDHAGELRRLIAKMSSAVEHERSAGMNEINRLKTQYSSLESENARLRDGEQHRRRGPARKCKTSSAGEVISGFGPMAFSQVGDKFSLYSQPVKQGSFRYEEYGRLSRPADYPAPPRKQSVGSKMAAPAPSPPVHSSPYPDDSASAGHFHADRLRLINMSRSPSPPPPSLPAKPSAANLEPVGPRKPSFSHALPPLSSPAATVSALPSAKRVAADDGIFRLEKRVKQESPETRQPMHLYPQYAPAPANPLGQLGSLPQEQQNELAGFINSLVGGWK